MPDIAMCNDHECPSTNICYRYQAIPNPNWQSYSDFGSLRIGDRCDSIIPIKGDQK